MLRTRDKRVAATGVATRFSFPDDDISDVRPQIVDISGKSAGRKDGAMPRDAKNPARRRFLTTGALGACGALASTARVNAAAPTAEEQANVRIVKEFCAAWAKKDTAKIESLLADSIAVRWSERAPWINGKATAFERMKGILERPGVERVELELVETYPKGPLVLNDRWDRTVRNGKMSQHRLASIFFVKDGKIVEWLDYDLPDPKTIRPGQ